jgi:hypothetical protein
MSMMTRDVSVKAVLAGFLCVVIISVFSPYTDLVVGTIWSGATYLPLNVVTIFTLVIFINIILRKINIGFTEHELLYIYCMMLVTGCIVSLGLVHSLIPITTGVFYHATKENRWQEMLHPHFPKWFVPSNPDTIKYLWEGLPKGVPIPWHDWVRPFIGWVSLAIGMYIVMYSLCLLLQKQWITNEHLVFPLVSLPLELCKEEKGKLLPPLLRNKVFWAGFLISAFPFFINGLHYYFPFVPSIGLFVDVGNFLKEAPWSALAPLRLNLIFSAIGLTYLLPTSLSFSLWVFFVYFRLQAVIGAMLGVNMPFMFTYPTRAFISYQIAGGMIVFCFFLLWVARNEIKKIFIPSKSYNNNDYMYKRALLGLLVGVLIICFWAIAAGVSVILLLLIFFLFLIIILAATRLSAEGGVYFFQASFRPSDIIMAFTGSEFLGVRNIVTLIGPVEHVFMRDQRAALMPNIMDILKISDSGNLKRKTVVILSWAAILVGIAFSFIVYIKLLYKIGGINCSGYAWLPFWGWSSQHTINLLTRPQEPNISSVFWLFVGCVSMVLVLFLRRVVLWVPLHPLGYIMGDSWPTVQLWFPIMLGWLLKTMILRLGGIKGYRTLMPGFLGLILGEYSMIGLWLLIDILTGVKGHVVAPFL